MGIVVTINLPGALGAPVKHTTKQTGVVDISPIGSSRPILVTRKIKHTDRVSTPCVRIVPISDEILTQWVKGECPYWIKPQIWKKASKNQKIAIHVSRLDEGFGYSYE